MVCHTRCSLPGLQSMHIGGDRSRRGACALRRLCVSCEAAKRGQAESVQRKNVAAIVHILPLGSAFVQCRAQPLLSQVQLVNLMDLT